MPAKSEEKRTARERILRAAIECFAEKGYAGTTTREIVRRAGSSLSMLDLCFGAKEALYKEVLRDILSTYVGSALPLFGEIVDLRAREDGRLRPDAAWRYIERITERHLRVIMAPEHRSAMLLLNREMQNKDHFDFNLEPALMYIYNYQLLFEEYAGAPFGSPWARILSFQTVTGMFSFLAYPNVISPLGESDPFLNGSLQEGEDVLQLLKAYHLSAMEAALKTFPKQKI